MDDKQLAEKLLSVIDRAYWRLEVGDRVGALLELSMYAKPKNSFNDHWLNIKKENKNG